MKTSVPVSCNLFEIDDDSLPNIKYHVFISKTTTKQLSDYVKKEDWGKDNVLLYKYLDYIWRFQLIDKMVKKFKYKNQYRLVFHSGLYKRNNNEPLYMCLIPNKTHKTKNVPQKWRVAFGSGTGNESFVLKKDLLNTYKLIESDLPVKTVFVGTKKDSTFNPFYSFTINAEERIRTTKDRIMNTIKNDIGLREDISIKKLVKILNDAIKESLNEVRNNPSLVGKQVFIERNIINDKKVTNGYHLELLIPLTLNINNKNVYFAMVLRPNHKKRLYEGMSIITREMAYSNSRLIGEVKLQWLKPFINANKPDFNITNNNNNINNNCNYNNINNDAGNSNFIYNINYNNIVNNNNNNKNSIINVNNYPMYKKDISAAMNNYITFDDAMNYFLIGYDNLNYASPKAYNLTYNIH